MRQGGALQSATIGVAFLLAVVWMQRYGRWSAFAQATAGEYVLVGTRGASSSTVANGTTTPAAAAPNTTTTQGSGSSTANLGPTQAINPSGGTAAQNNQSPPAPTSL